jgi:arylsulfatase A-like enzyme
MTPEVGFDDIYQPEVNIQNFAISMTEPRFRVFHSWLHNPIGFALVPVIRHNQAFGKSYNPTIFADAAADQLAQSSQHDQFFYALHSCVLHAPGDRNYPWSMKFGQKGYEGPNRFRYSRSGSAIMKESTDDLAPVKELVEQDLRIYNAGLSMADELVEKLVGSLKESGLWDNSIVILVSDHGENMWAPDLPYRYRGPNHGFHPYGEGQHHVAMAIRFPNGEFSGQIVDAPVRLIDITPTIVDYLQLDWAGDFDGASMMPLLLGEKEPEPRMVYIETGLSEPKYWPKDHKKYPFKKISDRYAIDFDTGRVHIKEKFLPFLVAAKDRSLQLGRWKLVWRPLKDGANVELYDRVLDPENRNNIYQKHPPVAAKLGLRLKPFLEKDGVDMVLFDVWEQIDRTQPDPDWWK